MPWDTAWDTTPHVQPREEIKKRLLEHYPDATSAAVKDVAACSGLSIYQVAVSAYTLRLQICSGLVSTHGIKWLVDQTTDTLYSVRPTFREFFSV